MYVCKYVFLAMWAWLCEGKLKVKIAHFRLPSAPQKCASRNRMHLAVMHDWPDLYWRRIIRPDGSSAEKDHPSSINTGRTMRQTIGVSCDSSPVYTGH